MVPASIISGEYLPGIRTDRQNTALRLYCYLDLKCGPQGWAVRGFRRVARDLGMQDRTVSEAARILSEAGLIGLELGRPATTSAEMLVTHNPSRGRINPDVQIGPTALRYRHASIAYEPSTAVRGTPSFVRHAPERESGPDAHGAAGSRSMRSERSDKEPPKRLIGELGPGVHCDRCLKLLRPANGESAHWAEFCSCEFIAT